MDVFDIAVLGMICCLIGVGFLFRNLSGVRLAVLIILFGINFGCGVILFSGPPRSLFDPAHRHTEEPRQEFLQGVAQGSRAAALLSPYIMVSSVGLLLVGLMGHRNAEAGSRSG